MSRDEIVEAPSRPKAWLLSLVQGAYLAGSPHLLGLLTSLWALDMALGFTPFTVCPGTSVWAVRLKM